MEVEETAGSGGDRISMLQVGGLHGGVLSADTVLMSVEEEGDRPSANDELGLGIVWNDSVLVVEFQVEESELVCETMGLRLGIFTRAQKE